MKYKILFILVVLMSCSPKPEFVINGKEYYTRTRCVKSHNERTFGYHWGYDWTRGEYRYHWGEYTETICDETKVDTIEIKH